MKVLEKPLLKTFVYSVLQKKMACSTMSSLTQWTTSTAPSILSLFFSLLISKIPLGYFDREVLKAYLGQ